jgi:uncharacterized protein YkwD
MGQTDDPVPSTPTEDIPDDDDAESNTTEQRPPTSINERAVAREVGDRLADHRREIGYQALTWSQSLAVAADERNAALVMPRMTKRNRRTTVRYPQIPFDRRSRDLGLDDDDIWERFNDSNAFECGVETDAVLGELSSGRDVVRMVEESTTANASSTEAYIAEDVVVSWRQSRDTRLELRDGYRYVGVDVRYERPLAAVLVTVSLC